MQATGIQIDGSVFRTAHMKRTGQGLRCTEMKTHSLDEAVKPLYASLNRSTLVAGINSSDLIIHCLPLPAHKHKKLQQALILQTEANLHLKMEELISLCRIEKKANQATIYSTTKPVLTSLVQDFSRYKLDPERVMPIPAALKAFIHWKAPEIESYFLVDIGLNATQCIWVENGVVKQAYSMPSGMTGLRNAFQEDRKKMIALKERVEIDFFSLKTGQYPTLADEARILRREISKLLYSFQCQRPLILTGEIDANGGLSEFLLEALRDSALEEAKVSMTAEEQKYAVCLGLAIEYLVHRDQPLQFRSGSATSSKTWQKLGQISALLLFLSILFSFLFYTIGTWWIDKRELEIVRSLEIWTASKDPTLRQELFSSGGKTENLVRHWIEIIDRNAAEYPFLMKAPRVAHFLNWITHHPLIESFRVAGDPMSFEELRYQLMSFPKLESLEDPYLAKVDLEVKVSSPLHARKFHEMLQQGDGLVDASREISWEVLQDRYKTSFYLKNENYAPY